MVPSCYLPHIFLLLLMGAEAWTCSKLKSRLSNTISLRSVCGEEPEIESSERRRFFGAITAASSLCIFPSSSSATAPVISSAATCDPTISIWKRGDRLVYLLGTAHISERSAELAGQIVQDVHPNAVFVELDLKRVGGTQLPPDTPVTTRVDLGDSKRSKIVVPLASGTRPPVQLPPPDVADSFGTNPAGASPPEPVVGQSPSGGLGKRLVGLGAAAIGRSIKGMYKNLDDSGFKSGEEFVVAVKEGQAQGADIILGDQDVEITLKRLTQALMQTDFDKLLDPDSELERGMRELMGGTAGTSENFKGELTTYVESLKTRENVTKMMGQLKQVAPALVQVMLTERDAYMSAGLDALNQYEVITAVMGIAHVDGVERNLVAQGWNQVRPTCSVRS